jgi:hypothetical protein
MKLIAKAKPHHILAGFGGHHYSAQHGKFRSSSVLALHSKMAISIGFPVEEFPKGKKNGMAGY